MDASIVGKFHFYDCAEVQVGTLETLAMNEFHAVRVQHCHLSYAFVFVDTTGWKFTFSGDCRPSEELIKVGQGSDLLIHEATFEASMVEEAKQKKHCTITEAIDVGSKMKASHVMLTHFSQRYPKLPPLAQTVAMAFDLLSCRPTDCAWLASILPQIQQMVDDNN